MYVAPILLTSVVASACALATPYVGRLHRQSHASIAKTYAADRAPAVVASVAIPK